MDKLNGTKGHVKTERRIQEKIDEIIEWINQQERRSDDKVE